MTKSLKSSYQKSYFINKRNTYDQKGRILKSEFLNNHVNIDSYGICKGDGSSLNDITYKFSYDENNNLIVKNAVFDEVYRRKVKNIKELNKDYSKYYKPYHSISFIRDTLNNIIQVNFNSLKKSLDYLSNKLFNKYDQKRRFIESYRKNKLGNIFGQFFEYHEDNNILSKKVKGYVQSKAGIKTLLKSLSNIIEYNSDGSFKITDYSSNQIDEIEYYNKHQDLTQTTDRYNSILSEIKYTYDSKGNWTHKTVFEKGKITEDITREITYYQ